MNKRKYLRLLACVVLILCALIIVAFALGKPTDAMTEEGGAKYIERLFSDESEVEYSGTDEGLGFYEYESEKRFYAIDPSTGEIMSVFSLDGTPIFENIHTDPLENAKALIEKIDDNFFRVGSREEVSVFENGETSVSVESLAADNIGTGRSAGVRLDSAGNITFLAFNISANEAEENAQTVAEAAITADEAIELAVEDAAIEPETLAAPGVETTARQSFYRSRQVWVVEIDHIKIFEDDDLESAYWYYIDTATGEIISSDRSA